MLIWGSGGKTVEAVRDGGVAPCPVCQGNQPFRIMLTYKYAHLWYLFSFITSRQYVRQCTRCNNGQVVEQRAIADRLGKTDPVPFMRRRGWLVGLGALAVAGSAAGVYAHQHGEDVASYVAAPQVGDLYRADLSKISRGFAQSPAWGLMRLEAIDGDHLAFRIASKAYTGRKGADKDVTNRAWRNAQYFSREIIRLPRQEVHRLREQSVIYDVDRTPATP